ncbi:MAG: hypothetical protein QG629_371 [Patescibacteria group bacterium]|nr:hypothetical protein [Candidatus Saccharibacteria bacterium]MDQ5963289.1 hypothetical protein [Patescibacteria group bacterium]
MSRGGFLGRRREAKNAATRATIAREVRRQGMAQPTFSYYANRMPSDTSRLRLEQTIAASELASKNTSSPNRLSQFMSWVGVMVFGVVVIKVLSLGTESRIIVSDKTNQQSISASAVGAYAAYANTLLKESMLNRTKVTINTGGIERAMQQKFPELESVVVTVPLLGGRPIVYVLPTPALVSIETTKGTFSLGSNGRVIAKIPEGANKGLVIRDLSGVPPEVGKDLLPSSTMRFIQMLEYQFSKANMPIQALTLPNASLFELDAVVAGKGGTVKFNLEEDPKQQSGAALAVIRRLNTTPWQYIDVRVPERVYYK